MGESDPQMRTEMPLPEEGIGDGAKGAINKGPEKSHSLKFWVFMEKSRAHEQ